MVWPTLGSRTAKEQNRGSSAFRAKLLNKYNKQVMCPGGGETICPRPMAVQLAADLLPSTDGSTVRTSLVAGQLQAASVPIA